jgi:hypothetical protein
LVLHFFRNKKKRFAEIVEYDDKLRIAFIGIDLNGDGDRRFEYYGNVRYLQRTNAVAPLYYHSKLFEFC